MKKLMVVALTLMVVLCFGAISFAGSLDDTGSPTDPSSAMFTLEDIYNRLGTGAAGAKRSGPFVEPSSGPASTGHTLDEVMGLAPTVDDTDGTIPAEVVSGKTFWGLTSGNWGLKTGTMTSNGAGETITPGTTDQTIAAGYWSSANTVSGDTNLVSANIRAGQNIFSVAGNSNVVNTSSGDAVAGEISNGKKAWVDGSEITGQRYGGCTCTGTLNGTRWCDNGDGTVTDLITCLVWLKDAYTGGVWAFWVNTMDGTNAHDRAAQFKDGVGGLTDGSVKGDWRLPTKTELYNLANGTEAVRSGNMRAFTGVQSDGYWSSTTYESSTSSAWGVYMGVGVVYGGGKDNLYYVWPVRSGN